jgi:uncharacterized protein YjbI with pentapeptide repeats
MQASQAARQVRIVSRWNSAAVLFSFDVPAEVASGMETRAALEAAVAARVVLSGADLRDADLRDADLRDAVLSDADLRDADLRDADLRDAVLSGADLRDADLRDADLSGAVLSDAVLRGAVLRDADLRDAVLSGAGSPRATPEESIAALDKVAAIILDDANRLEMGHWHGGSDWRARTCAEEAVCGTTHCLAGWLQVCSTDKNIREMDTQTAGILCAPVASKMFFRDADTVLTWLKDRKYVADLDEAAARKLARDAKRAGEAQS